MISDAPTRGLLGVDVTPESTGPLPGLFRLGDHITWNDKAATVKGGDGEIDALLVRFDSGETSAVPLSEAKLANEDDAVSSARGGLAHLLSVQLMPHMRNPPESTSWVVNEAIKAALATDEAQRLIRLHG